MMLIVGIRPQYIKLAGILKAVDIFNKKNSQEKINAITINTGQHYDDMLSGVFQREFNLNFDFQINHLERSPTNILANSIVQLDNILTKIPNPVHWAVVFGDGTPALVGALIAARSKIPIAHIEAGVNRSLNEPEGVNRKVVDALSTAFFCVTDKAIQNLKSEGITENVFWTGDVGYEFLKEYAANLPSGYFLKENGEYISDYILASLHRQGNLLGDTLRNVLLALNDHSREVIFVAHPRTRQKLDIGEYTNFSRVRIVDPMSYQEIISALKGSAFVITDSGGLIREAYHLQKRCLVRRNQAGWPLLIEAGINKRISCESDDIKLGLKWAEAELSKPLKVVDGIVRENAATFVLETLIKLISSSPQI